jgi:signal transduction histidine kinase
LREPSDQPAQLNARILHPLARFLREQHGDAALAKAARAGAIDPAQLDGRTLWIGLGQIEKMLEAVRSQCEDDDGFKRACAYRLADGYGAIRFVLWATSPQAVYLQAMKTFRMVCSYGENEVVSTDRNRLHVRFRTDRAEGRLVCLMRQAQIGALPTLWNLPPAIVTENACLARGDPYCGYELRWYDRKRWLPTALGLAAGSAAYAGLAFLGHHELSAAAIPLLGGAIGYILEMSRTGAANLAVREEVNEALRELAREEAEARHEILALHQRQRDWTRMLEEDAAERSVMLQRVADRLHRLQEMRDTKILGFSHDLRNPLTVLQAGSEYLRDYVDVIGDEGDAVLGDIERAIEQMRRLLEDLMTMATQQAGSLAQLAPQRLEVPPLTDRLRRRLRALVQGKDIRASVFKTREAPDSIETDPLLFDRVVDNLLTNAAKYTDRGSIVVEVDGTTEYLTLKVSDTGRGISPEQIDRAFTPEGSDRSSRAKNSYGVGLSVVVQLLGQVGGRLEVMSKPDSGTTFWVHFPLTPVVRSKPPALESDRPIEKYNDVLNRVVTIRRVKAS